MAHATKSTPSGLQAFLPTIDRTRTRALTIASWIFQIACAAILLQTLYFKFTGAPEAKYIFTTLGVEPFGRIGLGFAELIVGILLLIPRTAVLGAIAAIGLMVGAIGSHLAVLGIEVQGDGGELFGLAVAVLIMGTIVLWIRRREIPILGTKFFASSK